LANAPLAEVIEFRLESRETIEILRILVLQTLELRFGVTYLRVDEARTRFWIASLVLDIIIHRSGTDFMIDIQRHAFASRFAIILCHTLIPISFRDLSLCHVVLMQRALWAIPVRSKSCRRVA